MQSAHSKRAVAATLALTLAILGATQSVDAATRHKSRHASAAGRSKDIVSTAQKAGEFDILILSLKKTGLDRTLRGKGPFTVFAPSDAAFGKIPKESREALLNDKDKLPTVLKYHVVPKKLMSTDLSDKRSVYTVQGEALMLENKDGTLVVDGAIVTKPDIVCGNGVIHVIDEVVVPERGK